MELFRALAVIAEPPSQPTEAVAAVLELPGRPDSAAYTDLFLLQLWPYASIYVGAEGKLGGEARDRVAGFWRALRMTPPAEPDHVAALLGLYATLIDAEAAELDPARRGLRRRSRQALLWEHLLSWLPPYLAKLNEIASPLYRAWGELLSAALIAEAEELKLSDRLPLHLREAPTTLADAADLTAGILTPARSGLVLVRDDLARAARRLGLGLRQGERTYVLKALLEQDPAATVDWLADEAKRWVDLHASMPSELGSIREFWLSRSRTTAEMVAAQIPA